MYLDTSFFHIFIYTNTYIVKISVRTFKTGVFAFGELFCSCLTATANECCFNQQFAYIVIILQ